MNVHRPLGWALFIAVAMLGACGGQSRGSVPEGAQIDSTSAIDVTLSMYSGLPNPSWELTGGPDHVAIIDGVGALSLSAESLFDETQWHNLGYAFFVVSAEDANGRPITVEVWQDMACVYLSASGATSMYWALGATDLYDVLIAQAEERGHWVPDYD